MIDLNAIRKRNESRAANLQYATEMEAQGDHACAQCGASVRVDWDHEWEAGDFCTECIHGIAHDGIADVAALLAEVDRLTADCAKIVTRSP